jgi:hypothetical protein
MIGRGSPKRLLTLTALVLLGGMATAVPAFVLGLSITVVLTLLALWEYDPDSLVPHTTEESGELNVDSV